MPCELRASRALGRREFFTRSVKNSRPNVQTQFSDTALSGARHAGPGGKSLRCTIDALTPPVCRKFYDKTLQTNVVKLGLTPFMLGVGNQFTRLVRVIFACA